MLLAPHFSAHAFVTRRQITGEGPGHYRRARHPLERSHEADDRDDGVARQRTSRGSEGKGRQRRASETVSEHDMMDLNYSSEALPLEPRSLLGWMAPVARFIGEGRTLAIANPEAYCRMGRGPRWNQYYWHKRKPRLVRALFRGQQGASGPAAAGNGDHGSSSSSNDDDDDDDNDDDYEEDDESGGDEDSWTDASSDDDDDDDDDDDEDRRHSQTPDAVLRASTRGARTTRGAQQHQQRTLRAERANVLEVQPSPTRSVAPHGHVFNLGFSWDGRCLVATCSEGDALVLDPRTFRQVSALHRAHAMGVNVVKFLDDRIFATCSDDATIKLWDLRKTASVGAPSEARRGGPAAVPIQVFSGHQSWVKNIELTNDGRLISAGLDNTIRVWSLSAQSGSSGSTAPSPHTTPSRSTHTQTAPATPRFETPVVPNNTQQLHQRGPQHETPTATPHQRQQQQQQDALLTMFPENSFITPPRADAHATGSDPAAYSSAALLASPSTPSAHGQTSQSLLASPAAPSPLLSRHVHAETSEANTHSLVHIYSTGGVASSLTLDVFHPRLHEESSEREDTLQRRSLLPTMFAQCLQEIEQKPNKLVSYATSSNILAHFPRLLCRMRVTPDTSKMVLGLRDATVAISNLDLDTLATDLQFSKLNWLARKDFVTCCSVKQDGGVDPEASSLVDCRCGRCSTSAQLLSLIEARRDGFSTLPSLSHDHDQRLEAQARREESGLRERNKLHILQDVPSAVGYSASLQLDATGTFLLSRKSIQNTHEVSVVHDLDRLDAEDDDQEPSETAGGPRRASSIRASLGKRPGAGKSIWDTSYLGVINEDRAAEHYIKGPCFNSDGRLIASPFGKSVRIFDCSHLCLSRHTSLQKWVECTQRFVPSVQTYRDIHDGFTLTSRFSPVTNLLVTGGLDGQLVFYEPHL